ncbi:MAG: hypothetical protein INR73_10015 [Williamsia sp.]|nr:hypothetical protein [Williamsia sp.]
MQNTLIRLCYRKVINNQATKPWEQYVFEDTYKEFLLQVQFYNQEKIYTSFGELVAQAPAAEQLHFLVSAAAVGYIKQLQGKVPDIANSLGRLFLPFENFRFEIINSDIRDRSKHQVAINFYTDQLVWHETIGYQLLVSVPGKQEGDETFTELFSLQPYLSIYSIKKL